MSNYWSKYSEDISPYFTAGHSLNMYPIQYIPRNMHTVFALLCFVVVIHWLIFPYPSGLLYWHCGNLTIAPVPAKQPWWIWINTSCEFIMNDCITTTRQSTTKPCAYFLGYTVPPKAATTITITIRMRAYHSLQFKTKLEVIDQKHCLDSWCKVAIERQTVVFSVMNAATFDFGYNELIRYQERHYVSH